MQSIRTKRHHHIRLAKLDAGYREQRAWLSVGMSSIIVELAAEPWAEHPLVVRYREVRIDGGTYEAEERFDRAQIDQARDLFKVAGRPGRWPNETVQSLNGEGENR